MEIRVPYGKDVVPLSLDDRRLIAIVEPNEVEAGDPGSVLLEAIGSPIGSRPLAEFLGDAREVLFIVNDGTRPTPTAAVLDVVRPLLGSVEPRFLVATGVHRAPTEEEYRFIFGSHLEDFRDRIHVHDARRDVDMVHVGTSKNGTDMMINRLAVEAERIVVIGSVEPHYFGGYTGGRKSFLPGIAAHRTIEQNHRHATRPEPRALLLEGNPVHEDMIDALGTIEDREIFSIQTVLDRRRRITAATAGDIHASFAAAIDHANEVYCVRVPRKAEVVVSVAPYPMDVDLYQSQKALDNGKLALEEGGILILVSKCRMGVGDRSFFDLLAGCASARDALERISGEYRLGYHKAAKLAEIALWAEMWAVTDLEDTEVSRAFMRPVRSLQEAVDAALEAKGPEARVLVMMDGSITVPMIDQEIR
jgi:nickel-dependent lactate racemase